MELQSRKPSAKGPAEWFTGDVWMDGIVQGEEPRRVRVIAVHFTPGARTAWHSHALGQTLYVTEGQGRVQSRGSDIVTIRPGDVVNARPDEEHWHGCGFRRFRTPSPEFSYTPAGCREAADDLAPDHLLG